MTYTLTSGMGVIRDADHAAIPADPRNADWQAYQAWLAAGNSPTPCVAPPAPITSMQVASTSTPAVNGSYAIDPAAQQKVQAISLYAQINGKFPAGQSAMPWADVSGAAHSFPTIALWQAFATAMADFVTALDLGQKPSQPVTIA
jgi:hypothetical protein